MKIKRAFVSTNENRAEKKKKKKILEIQRLESTELTKQSPL